MTLSGWMDGCCRERLDKDKRTNDGRGTGPEVSVFGSENIRTICDSLCCLTLTASLQDREGREREREDAKETGRDWGQTG